MTDEARELPETPEMPEMAPRRGDRHREGRPLLAFGSPRAALGRMSWPMAVAGVVVALLVVATIADAGLSWGRIHAGVTVGGVAVGGMDPSAARAVLDRELSPRVKLPVNLVFESRRWVVQASRIGARVPVDDLVVTAYQVGRSGNALAMLGDRLGAWFGRTQLPAAADGGPREAGGRRGGVRAQRRRPAGRRRRDGLRHESRRRRRPRPARAFEPSSSRPTC